MAIYNKTTWANNITPLNQENMNHIEEGIFTVSSESYTTCIASYSSDTLQLIFKNAGNEQLGSAITVNIPTGTSLTSISYNTSTNQLSYTDRNGSTTNIVEIYDITKVYNKTEIDTTLANYYTKTEVDTTKMISITWASLKELRDTGKLIPGQQYRITDYTCTTATLNTSSAGHVFDIIVIADDVNVLNENARACLHDGDTYFANNDLSIWKLKYCIDNDTTRFAWADNTNGKGVIFWLKDEFNNECPYDFKNILFTKVDAYTNAYTFTYRDVVLKDASIFGISKGCYNNVIKEYYSLNKLQLNWNIFYSSAANESFNCYSNRFGNNCYSNTFGYDCYSNTFGNNCYSNTFGYDCQYNIFGNDCHYNKFGYVCSYNTFGNTCHHNTFDAVCNHNTFGNHCYSNTFGGSCDHNTFGNNCYSNTFVGNCDHNTFGNNCYSNTFGSECSSNTFGNYCYANTFDNECPYNTFGNHCYSNTFGKNCYSNTFDNDCHYNKFGIYCSYNTFGDDCQYNTFGTSSSAINYCRHIIFDNGCSYIYLSSADTTASRSNRLQNVHIHLGVMGSSDQNRLSIVVPDRALTYSIDYYASNSETIEV